MAEPAPRGLGGWVGVFARGMAMGVAELIPGVSGGTIAFITGIYLELVRTLRGLGPELVRRVTSGGLREAWAAGNLGFLAALGAGMGTAVLLLARVVEWLLVTRELELWGFFFGLILASTVFVARHVTPWTPGRGALALGGTALGVAAAFLTALSLPVNPVTVFLGAAVAICAWVLPGVSGSFILLLLGLYPAMVAAISSLDLAFLLVFAAGCGVGLLLFARVLTWLLERRYEATLALLTGFMAGSLLKLWPWQLPVSMVDGKPVGVRLLSPGAWSAASGEGAATVGVVVAMTLGVLAVVALELGSRVGGGGREGGR